MKTFHPDPFEQIIKEKRQNKDKYPTCKFVWYVFVMISMLNPVENLHISSVTAPKVPDLSKALAILSDASVRRSTVDREDLKR